MRFKSILCVVDSLSKRHPALERAATLARQCEAKLSVVDVVRNIGNWFSLEPSYLQVLDQERANGLQKLVGPFRQQIAQVSTALLRGRPAIEVTRLVLLHGIELVVKDARGTTGHKTLLLGSTDMRLLRNCPCPVWLVAADPAKHHKRVLAAVDMQSEDEAHKDLNERIIDLASSLAKADAAELHIVSAWNAPGEALLSGRISEERLSEYVDDARRKARHGLERLLESVPLDVDDSRVRFRKGEPANVILEFASEINCDLLVMGTVAQTGLEGLLMGNTADTVLRQIECSVLAVKPDGFVSPVKP